MVFQDPYLSLNPRLTIGSSIEEVMKIQGVSSSARRKEKVGELLNDVGLRADMVGRFPHEFSGGQRQRASLARALAANPGILVADEPVSALDVSVQAQIIKLLIDLQKKYELAMIFISHDLSVVKYISDKVAVMYLGEIVEAGPASAIFRSPRHPYTEALMKSVPRIGVPVDDIDPIVGEIPSNISPPSGCKFNPRCRYRQDICSARIPDSPNDMSVHYARCHFADKLKLEGI
jgi:oligopeptide/dipeptide ABC transporter ATP-binding protein